jgi:dethiobiotin synthetase
MKPFRLFVAGTDTGIGKTETACAVLSLLADAGRAPVPFKPYESGCADLRLPADALALRAAARSDVDLARICVHRFKAPLAPGIAAERLGVTPDFERTLETYRGFRGRSVVVEAAGGLLVPLDPRHDGVDLIVALKLPVLLVARAGLGTLNHTGLSVEALRRRRAKVAGIVLSRSGPARDPSERDNPRVLRERYGIPVLGPVAFVRQPSRRRAAFRRVLAPWLAGLGAV